MTGPAEASTRSFDRLSGSLRGWKADPWVLAITVLVAPLFLYGLGDTYLWYDEAQTALLGRSVAAHGVPMVGHGAESLSAQAGDDAGYRGWFVHIPWLQAYLAAASFMLFGESSWAARLPFAIAGWLCVPLVAWAMRRAGAGVLAARLAALLTGVNLSFILYSRQARYYPLAAAAVLLLIGAYASVARQRAWEHVGQSARPAARASQPTPRGPLGSSWFLGAAACLLVLSFDLTAAGVLGGIALHWLLAGSQAAGGRRWDTRIWVPWMIAAVLLACWLALTLTAASRQPGGLPVRLAYRPVYYLGQLNVHVVPLPLLLVLAVLPWRGARALATDDRVNSVWAAGLWATVALGAVGGACLAGLYFLRYAVPAFVPLIGLLAIGLEGLARRGRPWLVLSVLLVAVLSTSNALLNLSHTFLSTAARVSGLVEDKHVDHPYGLPLLWLLSELREPPRGPVRAVGEYLREHAERGEALVATYGELPMKFHTELEVYGGLTGEYPPARRSPEWLWVRRFPTVARAMGATVQWVDDNLSLSDYESIELGTPDRRWENRGDPDWHVFTTPGPPAPPVVLHRRR